MRSPLTHRSHEAWGAHGKHSTPQRCTPNGSWVPFNGSIPYTFSDLGYHENHKRPQCNTSKNWKYTWQSSRHGVESYLSSHKLCNLVPKDELVVFVGDSLSEQLFESWETRVRIARGVHDPCYSRVRWSKNMDNYHLWGLASSSGVLDFNDTTNCSEANHRFCPCIDEIQSSKPKPFFQVVDNDLSHLNVFGSKPTVVIVNQFAHLGRLFQAVGNCYQNATIPNDPYVTAFEDVFTFWRHQVALQARAMSKYAKRTGARIFYRTSAVPSTLNLTVPSSHAGLYSHPKAPSLSSVRGPHYWGHEFYWLVNDMSSEAYTRQGLSVLDAELMLGSRLDASAPYKDDIHTCLPGAVDLALDQLLLAVYKGRDCVSEP